MQRKLSTISRQLKCGRILRLIRSWRWWWGGQQNSRRTSRRQQSISSSCRQTRTRTKGGAKPGVLCCSGSIQRFWLSRVVEWMTLSPTRGRTRWRHGGDYRSDMIRRQEEETKPSAHDEFSWSMLSSGTSSGCRTLGVPRVSLRELALLSHWCPSGKDKHLILNSNHIRGCAPVTRKFGLRVYSSKKGLARTRLTEKGRYDDESDRSLSSLSSVRELMLPWAADMTRQGHQIVNRWGQSKLGMSFLVNCASKIACKSNENS